MISTLNRILILAAGMLLGMAGSASQAEKRIEFDLDVEGLAAAAHPKQYKNPGVISLSPGKPLKLQLTADNPNAAAHQRALTIRVIKNFGEELWRQDLESSFPPGKTEFTYELFDEPGSPQEGMFLAQVLGPSNGKKKAEITWRDALADLLFGYFPEMPEIPEEPDAPILILRDRLVVGQIEAQRTWPTLPDYTRLDPIVAQTSDGGIYAMFQENHYAETGDTRAQSPTLIGSTDGGRSWQLRQVTLDPLAGNMAAVRSFGIAADDKFFVAYSPLPDADPQEMARRIERVTGYDKTWVQNTNIFALCVASSTDQGNSWSQGVQVDVSSYNRVQGLGRFYQGGDGAVWFNLAVVGPHLAGHAVQETGNPYDGVFRSRDGGKTWGDVTLMPPGGAECQLLQLASGRWLSTFRSSGRPGACLSPDGTPINIFGLDELPTYEKTSENKDWPGQQDIMHKRTYLLESKDGRDWRNLRPLTTIFGDTPGELIQLPDGRLLFLYCHRYAPQDGIYGRVSHDEGRTWQPDLLALRNACGGYSCSTVLKDGTIVSMVAGETIQAVRWRLPAEY